MFVDLPKQVEVNITNYKHKGNKIDQPDQHQIWLPYPNKFTEWKNEHNKPQISILPVN